MSASVRLEPLRAISVLQMDLTTAPSMIDLLLGGEGKASEPRELTDIEEAILSGVVEAICRELTTAWQPVGLSFSFEKRQMQTQTPRLIPVSEKTLCLSFELRLAETSGLLNLAFPAVAFEYNPAPSGRGTIAAAASFGGDSAAHAGIGRRVPDRDGPLSAAGPRGGRSAG